MRRSSRCTPRQSDGDGLLKFLATERALLLEIGANFFYLPAGQDPVK